MGEGAGWVEHKKLAQVALDFGDAHFVNDVVVRGCGKV